MPGWFKYSKPRAQGKQPIHVLSYEEPGVQAQSPPAWTPAPEQSHQYGLRNEAAESDYDAAETFCARYPVQPPRLLPSDVVDRIAAEGGSAWTMTVPRSRRFVGQVREGATEKGGAKTGVCSVRTEAACRETCLFSSLPIMAGLYAMQGKSGVYFEVVVRKMDGIIAIGTVTSVRLMF